MAFIRSEDILTSTVFERLAYLDGPTLWALLSATFRPRILPDRRVAELAHIEFWPTWGQAKETLNKAVEPDVVLRFSVGDPPQEIVLIVECKLGGLQYPEQWAQEWIAYRAENASEDGAAETCLLALGGLTANAEAMVEAFGDRLRETHGIAVKAAAADWHDLLKALDKIEVTRAADRRVVADVRAALALHGYRQFTPMFGLAAIASEHRIDPRGMARLRWAEDVPAPGRAREIPDQAPPSDPLRGWVERVEPHRPIRDCPAVLRSLADA
ncbi:hypothetical protein [Methylorubrum sp. POS3]|uniref:hypothetical protein n=1 Tax=Methylorubrum sp. POS3 TaxID=2998492 RepID=UPI00372BF015